MLDYIRQKSQSWLVKVIFAIIILVFILYFGVGGINESQNPVLAKVNGKAILIKDFEQAYQNEVNALRRDNPEISLDELKARNFKQQVFERLVIGQLLLDEARKVGIGVSLAELQGQIAALPAFQDKNKRFDDSIYRAQLRRQGLTPGDFENYMRQDLAKVKLRDYVIKPARVTEAEARDYFDFKSEEAVVEFLVVEAGNFTGSVNATDQEIGKYYEENPDQFLIPPRIKMEYLEFTPKGLASKVKVTDEEMRTRYDKRAEVDYTQNERVKVRHILIEAKPDASDEEAKKAEAKAQEVLAKLEGGESFEELAVKYSQGPSAPRGGLIGWIEKNQTVPPFEKAAFALAPGNYTKSPVRTEFGYHLILSEAHEPTKRIPFEEVKDQVKTAIAEEKSMDILSQLLEQALDAVDSMDGDSVDMKKIADQLGLPLQTSDFFSKNQGKGLFGLEEKGLETLFTLIPGDALDLAVENGYILTKVLETKPEEHQPLADVKEDITQRIVQEKTMVKAKEKAESLLEQAKKSGPPQGNGTALVKTSPFGRRGIIPEIGYNPGLAADCYKLKPGQWLPKVYQAGTDSIIARLVERIPPTDEKWTKEKEMWIEFLSKERKNEMFIAFIDGLRQKAEIKLVNPRGLEER